VLVVDDNADGVDSLATVLSLSGHQPRAARDGQAALAVAREFRPEVAFLDIGMPDMSGYELARRFRADPDLKDIPLVALTGWGSAEDRRRAAAAGFDHHLTKPVDAAAIAELLTRIDARGRPCQDPRRAP
jgi:CheY-like chemotaxis protein